MDTWLNPLTADYAQDAAGRYASDPAGGLANAVYIRLRTPLGSWWADPALGSRLHELQRSKAAPGIDATAQAYARAALAPLLADGRASSIDVATTLQVVPDGSKRLVLQITIIDAADQARVFEHHVKVV